MNFECEKAKSEVQFFNGKIRTVTDWRYLLRGFLFGFTVALMACFCRPIRAQVIVHLPQYSQFRVNSSFFVPDGGSMYQGGFGRMGMGYQSSGIPMLGNVPGLGRVGRNQGIGYSTQSTGVVTTARIYNMREIGDGILNGTHDSYGNLIQNQSIDPFQKRKPSRPSPNAFGHAGLNGSTAIPMLNDRSVNGMSSSPSAGTSQRQQLSPDQVSRRAQFLKANLGRNQ